MIIAVWIGEDMRQMVLGLQSHCQFTSKFHSSSQ